MPSVYLKIQKWTPSKKPLKKKHSSQSVDFAYSAVNAFFGHSSLILEPILNAQIKILFWEPSLKDIKLFYEWKWGVKNMKYICLRYGLWGYIIWFPFEKYTAHKIRIISPTFFNIARFTINTFPWGWSLLCLETWVILKCEGGANLKNIVVKRFETF